MTLAQLSPTPVFKAFANDGTPLAYGKLYSYIAGTTTPQATYPSQSESTPNTNPITLNARGECALWLDPTLSYKFNLTDALGNQIAEYPVDNIVGGYYPASSPIDSVNIHYDITAGEIAAGVTPAVYSYPPPDIRRYGAIASPAFDCQTAFNNCLSSNNVAYVPPGMWYSSQITVPGGAYIYGDWKPSGVMPFTPGSQTILFNCSGTGFPSGESLLTKFQNLIIYGNGATSCIGIYGQYVDNLELDSVILDGVFKSNIYVTDGQYLYLRKVRCNGAVNWNVYVNYTTGLAGANCWSFIKISDCEFYSCESTGISGSQQGAVYLGNVAALQMINTDFLGNDALGLICDQTYDMSGPQGSSGFYIANCEFDSNASAGAQFNRCRNITVSGCWFSSGRTNKNSGLVFNNCADSRIQGSDFFACGDNGIYLSGSTQIAIIGNSCGANGQTQTAGVGAGILLGSSTYCKVAHNICTNNNYGYLSQLQQVGVTEQGSADFNTITDNTVTGNVVTGLFYSGAHTIIRDNLGFATESSGVTGAIATGATVTHGLGVTPALVLLTPLDGTPTGVFPSALGSSTFTINFAGGGSHAFNWRAQGGNSP
jgi:hypothetical protein